MPLVKELASRGHQVTVVIPFAEKKPIPNVEFIINDSGFEAFTASFSKKSLKSREELPNPFGEMMELALDSNDNTLSHPQMLKYIKDKVGGIV